VECCKYTEAIIESKALAIKLEVRTKETPDLKWTTGSFEPTEGVKEVPLDPRGSNNKTVRIGTTLDPK
jgi:hypothetical protein